MSEALTKYLIDNPHTNEPNTVIGERFGVSESTVRRRKRKLRKTQNTHASPLRVSGSDKAIEFENLVSDNPLDPTGSKNGAFQKIFDLAGVDPKHYELVQDTFKFSTWQQSRAAADGTRDLVQLYSYKGTFRKMTGADLDAREAAQLLALAKPSPAETPNQNTPYARIVVAGDLQVGKVDHRGGTPELLERVALKTAALTRVLAEHPTETAYLLDPGDLTEGFENVTSQKFLNDLSLPSMLRVSRAVLTDLVATVADHAQHTTVMTVPSNHGAWRSGKGYLGKPSDDFGLDVHQAVSEVFAATNRPVTWIVPQEWDESVAVQIGNTKLGLVHGHQARAGQFVNWWRGQALGSGPVADANVCVSGHYHNTLYQTAGYLDGRERIHIQSPPLDNGSNWWRNLTGDQSTPGILTFLLDLDTGAVVDFRVV